ncbi:flagella basal body P-ring formation protein FlgA [Marinospirillum celere]|uniref:Flagella basal body P-ring formation protein FlgA n=1 Tax=Marinospirillum celere TaxID=1122252 RepID=A0A1I1FFU8_9GAMM|nr:flagellar basal body P-ring formation chaperone FlgA [Marinospirillum celere]SFB98154.1 flagella basal body P-ring formation protein FlgA [Marinospirillum celere]
MLRKQGLKIRSLNTLLVCTLGLILQFFASSLNAQSHQDLEALLDEARSWVSGQMQEHQDYRVEFRPLDPRLRLDRCSSPLLFAVHGNSDLRGRVNLRVTCQEENWFIFITAEVQVLEPVVVARSTLDRGARLSTQMLEVRKMDTSRIRGDYFSSIQEVVGMQVRNRIRAGDPVTSRQINVTQAVNRGDQVIIQARSETLRIRMTGEALEAGRIGDQIRVRNLQSGRTLRARIVDRGLVEVQL